MDELATAPFDVCFIIINNSNEPLSRLNGKPYIFRDKRNVDVVVIKLNRVDKQSEWTAKEVIEDDQRYVVGS